MSLKKNIILGKAKTVFSIIFICQLFSFNSYSDQEIISEKFAELIILDKVSSKTSSIKVQIGEEFNFQNLLVNVLKCQNSKLKKMFLISLK